jgi:hypothetical protein
MSDEPPREDRPPLPRLGDLGNAQRYDAAQMRAIARAAAPLVLGAKDAGKVYCPFCKLREARWKRSLGGAGAEGRVELLVYCTQCHKTGVTAIDLDRFERDRRRTRLMAGAIALLAVGALLLWLASLN